MVPLYIEKYTVICLGILESGNYSESFRQQNIVLFSQPALLATILQMKPLLYP